MKKLLKNSIVQEHIIPTLIVLSWFGILLTIVLTYLK
jgi:hypothetical protein